MKRLILTPTNTARHRFRDGAVEPEDKFKDGTTVDMVTEVTALLRDKGLRVQGDGEAANVRLKDVRPEDLPALRRQFITSLSKVPPRALEVADEPDVPKDLKRLAAKFRKMCKGPRRA